MSGIARGLAVAVVVSLPTFAAAHGLHGYYRPAVVYYRAVLVYLPPVVVIETPQPGIPPSFAVPARPDCPPVPWAPPAQAPGMVPTNLTWAQPTPAPPSTGPVPPVQPAPQAAPSTPPPPSLQTPPPPTAPKVSPMPPPPTSSPPAVSESHSFTSTFEVCGVPPRSGEKPDAKRCSVGFWNLTAQELTLTIDGQKRTLPAGKNLTLDLGRQFVWQVAGRDPQNTTVAAGDVGAEIIIRR
jgi:hypothetical protein